MAMVLLATLSASHDSDASTNHMKNPVLPYFNYHDLANAMMLLMMAQCDANTSASSIM